MTRDAQLAKLSPIAGRRVLLGYIVAGAGYVTIGVFFPTFLFSWVVAAAYLLFCMVLVPSVVRRLFR